LLDEEKVGPDRHHIIHREEVFLCLGIKLGRGSSSHCSVVSQLSTFSDITIGVGLRHESGHHENGVVVYGKASGSNIVNNTKHSTPKE